MIRSNSHTAGYEWLSNFYPCVVFFEEDKYPSVEHAYQAAKTLDKAMRLIIANATSASKAKRIGKHVTIREDWPVIKLSIMTDLLSQKFAPGTTLGTMLLETGDQPLIHYAPWDAFWGDGPDGKGDNYLGQLQMAQRERLRYVNSATAHASS